MKRQFRLFVNGLLLIGALLINASLSAQNNSDGGAFDAVSDRALQAIKKRAEELKIKGVAIVAYAEGETVKSWSSKMIIVGSAHKGPSKDDPEEMNLISIAYSKAAEMADTLKDSGSGARPPLKGEYGWQGGLMAKWKTGHVFAVFSGGTSEEDVNAAQAGLETYTATSVSRPIQTGEGHHFICSDNNHGLFIVSKEGKVEWDYPVRDCNDVWMLPNGNVLFNTGHGVKEVTRDKKVVFNYQSRSEIYACQRLPNGNTFIGECNAGRLLVMDPFTNIVKEIRILPQGMTNGGHSFMRISRVLANGNYLVTLTSQNLVREYDPNGKTLRDIPAPGGPHNVIRLPNGNTLISCGEGVRVFEVDSTGKTVWEVKDGDLPGISFKWMHGLQRLPNGNTVMCDWLGHGNFPNTPHIIEVTPDKRVVWTWDDHQTMRTVSSAQMLDAPISIVPGETLH